MSIVVNVNGESINYPQTGDTNWGDEATDFAVQTSSAFAKVGLSTGTTVDLPGTLDVTGATTLDSTLTVAGITTLNGTANLNGNTNLGNAITDTIAVTGIVNVNSGVLYVDPTNSRVGINDTTPSEALDVTGNAIITGNLAVDTNTLYVDATNNRVGIVNSSPSKALDVTGEIQSSSHITCNGVVYADDDTTANTPVISFIGDTNTGIGRSASDTLDFITNGNSRFRIESTGQIKAVYESTLGTDYNTQLDNGYLCRAWVNFDGTSSNLTGTYSRTLTTITVSITSHGLSTGQSVYLDFTTGTGTDAIYTVTVINLNSYTVTDTVSGATSGNVTQFRYIRASGNVSSITDNGVGDYTINFATALPDANYSVHTALGVSNTRRTIATYGVDATGANVTPTTSSVRLITFDESGVSIVDTAGISVAVFR